VEHGWPRVQAISQWLHDNIEYRYMSGRADLSAWDVLQRGRRVPDFAHLAVALKPRPLIFRRATSTGHLPDIGFSRPGQHMDFHAYAEVYLGGNWFTTDARFHVPRIGGSRYHAGRTRWTAPSPRSTGRRRLPISKCGRIKLRAARWASAIRWIFPRDSTTSGRCGRMRCRRMCAVKIRGSIFIRVCVDFPCWENSAAISRTEYTCHRQNFPAGKSTHTRMKIDPRIFHRTTSAGIRIRPHRPLVVESRGKIQRIADAHRAARNLYAHTWK